MDCLVLPTAAEWAQLLTGGGDFLRAVAWPVTIAAIAYFFRHSITAFLSRVIKLTPAGAELSSPAEQQQLDRGATPEPPGPAKDALAQDPALVRWRQQVEPGIEQLFQQEDLATAKSRVITTIAWGFRRDTFHLITRAIFGSQIELLTRLRGRLARHGDAAFVDSIYKLHAANAGDSAIGKPAWLQYLLYHNLVEGDESGLTLTPEGRAYTEFLTDTGETSSTKPW